MFLCFNDLLVFLDRTGNFKQPDLGLIMTITSHRDRTEAQALNHKICVTGKAVKCWYRWSNWDNLNNFLLYSVNRILGGFPHFCTQSKC